jgi:KDO2-lipid IV(A) lauroyltransferase
MGIAVFELGLSWWGDRRKLERMFHLEGIEHIEGAKAAGRGVLLVCCHMGPHELCATLFAPHSPVPCLGIYKPFKNPVVDRVSVVSRSRFAELAQRSSLRKAIRHLRDGGAVWYAPDQSEGRPGGILVPFFGEPKVVNTGPARLAAASNALVMPFHTWRDADGYHVAILPALERFPSGDATADARSIMEACEVHILRAPAQYSWTHRRFRKRLGQLPSPY